MASFRETFHNRPRSGSAEFLFSEIRNAFDPNSKFIQTWNQVVLLSILFELFALPHMIVFDNDNELSVARAAISGATFHMMNVLYACEVAFCIDIYVQLHTGYYEDGNVLRDTRKSRLKYLKSWAFVLDVAALPPLSLLLLPSLALSIPPLSSTIGAHRAYLELHKLLRLRRLPKLISNLDNIYARYFVLLKLAKVLVMTLLISHLVACGRFAFGYDTHHTNQWLPKAPAHGEPQHSAQRQYLMSLFWAFGMLTGLFEGELPHRGLEFVFNTTVALCGFSLFTYLCATFFVLSKCEGGDTETAEARVNQLKHLLAFHRVPTDVQLHAVEYLKRYYAQVESNDREASKLLCPSITVDIQVELLQGTVATIPVFEKCDAQFVKAVTSLLDMVSYPAQFVLFRAGDHGDAMYVVSSGVLHTLVNGVKVRELRKDSFFGELAVFANVPRSATMITATYCTLYRLSRFEAEKLLQAYPRCARWITETVARMLQVISSPYSPKKEEEEDESTAGLEDSSPRRLPTSLIQAVGIRKPSARKESRPQNNGTRSSSVVPEPKRDVEATKTLVPDESPNQDHNGASSPSTNVQNPTAPSVHRQSTTRHMSWKAPGTQKVTPAPQSPPHSNMLRRGSVGSPVNVLSRKPVSLVQKSRSQLELIKSSLLKLGRGSIDAVRPDVMKGFYDQIQRRAAPKSGHRRWWNRLLMKKCIRAESRLRMVWLLVLQLNLCYNWVIVPLQLAFPLFDRPRWYITALNFVFDVTLWIDIYVNLNLSFSVNSETILDTTRSAERYVRSGHMLADVVCSFPYEAMMLHVSRSSNPVLTWIVGHTALRVPRLFRAWRLYGHYTEVEEFLSLKSKQRLMILGFLLVMLYHIVACLHFSITYWEGFSPNEDAWTPSSDIFLDRVNSTTFIDIHGEHCPVGSDVVSSIRSKQYFRSLYYAANVLAALGKTIEPSSDRQYGIALLFMLSGFLITAIVVDNVQKRFTSSALEQKEFFATRARIQLFLKRQDAPLAIHQRVNSFLDYWWSSHRGAIIGELLEELPETIKRDVVRRICKPALESIGLLFPNIWTEENRQAAHLPMGAIRQKLEDVFLDNLKFVLYGQGEVIYRKGDYPSGLYFLLDGQVCVESGVEPPRRVPVGGCFGTASLSDGYDTICGHTEQVVAQSGCIVVYVSREHLSVMQTVFPEFASAVRTAETRAVATLKVTRVGAMESGVTKTIRPGARGGSTDTSWREVAVQSVRKTIAWKIISGEECFDPDAAFIGYWEVWVFAAMTLQSTLVIYYTCFGVDTGSDTNARRFVISDALMLFLEGCFVLDMFIRTRLGYYEYGNKVMSLRHIRAHYVGSKYFVIDVLALLPTFLVNWLNLGATWFKRRIELVNINKLLRLLKASSQFRALEAKHVKLTLELRLFRLLYYTFLASHTFGCIWFDFAARSSGLQDSSTTVFGKIKWLPYASLEFASRSEQYFASLFWSFGLMTASSTGDLPKTVSQCLFSVITMTAGFFLFAYVIGNFLDVIELQDSENRHFISKLSSLRHLLRHFHLPQSIDNKFKTYFFFKRFHSITQEHVLERVLPPSLLIDIRMFQLQPMIVKVAFLAGMEDAVTRMLVSQFTQVLVVKDMYICKYGEEGKEMFFIFTGVLDIYIPLTPSSANPANLSKSSAANPIDDMALLGFHKVNQITAGNYFGEAALFTKAPRNAYVKAKTSCILYRLSRESLELVFDRFPEWKQKVLRIVKIQQEQQRLMRLAAEAQAADSGETSPIHRRGLKRMMSRIDLINSRAEKMEEIVLASTRGGQAATFSPIEWLLKKATLWNTAKCWLKPAATRLLHWVRQLYGGVEVQTTFYLFWLRLVSFSTIYVAIIVPYRCAYDDLDRLSALPVIARICESICDIIFCCDIWFHFRVKGSLAALELYEQDHLQAYKRERLLWDVLAVLPVDYFVIDQFSGTQRVFVQKWLRLNRCLKVANLTHYRLEVNRRSVTYELNRLVTLWMLYLLAIYWTSCAYFAVAMMHEGFGSDWQAWLPAQELYNTDDPNILMLRLLRGTMFAVTAFVKKAKTFTPIYTLNYAFAISASFIGQLITALMIGEVASIFLLYIDNEVEFRKSHIALELFLSRKRLSPELNARCSAFLTSWWSSHAGVNYQLIFDDLPPTVRTEGITHIAQKPLSRFVDRVFRPLTGSASELAAYAIERDIASNGLVAVDNLMHDIAQHLHFEGYPRGENVVVEGTVCRAVFFVVKGYLYSKSVSNPGLYHANRYGVGDYFGEKGLLGHAVSLYTVSAVRACDLFVLRSEHLLEVIKSHSSFSVIFKMAQELVKQSKTVDEFFADAINKDRREVLRLRLSNPLLPTGPPSTRRLQTTNTRSVNPAAVGPEQRFIQQTFQQSRQLEWEEAFRLFVELLVPRGTLTITDQAGETGQDDGEDGDSNVPMSPRMKRAKSSFACVPMGAIIGSSDLSDGSGPSIRRVASPSPTLELVSTKRRTTSSSVPESDLARDTRVSRQHREGPSHAAIRTPPPPVVEDIPSSAVQSSE